MQRMVCHNSPIACFVQYMLEIYHRKYYKSFRGCKLIREESAGRISGLGIGKPSFSGWCVPPGDKLLTFRQAAGPSRAGSFSNSGPRGSDSSRTNLVSRLGCISSLQKCITPRTGESEFCKSILSRCSNAARHDAPFRPPSLLSLPARGWGFTTGRCFVSKFRRWTTSGDAINILGRV